MAVLIQMTAPLEGSSFTLIMGLPTLGLNPVFAESTDMQEEDTSDCSAERTTEGTFEPSLQPAHTARTDAEANRDYASPPGRTSATRKCARLANRDNILSLERAISRKILLRKGELSTGECSSRKTQQGLMKKVTPAGQGATMLNRIKSKSSKCGILLTVQEADSLAEFQCATH